MHNDIIFSIFLIFCGAAFLATLALFTRQSLLVAYIILGVLIGPGGIGLIRDPVVLKDVGDIGIIFLLFLLGLNLQPQNLIKMLRQATIVTLASSLIFALLGYCVALAADFSNMDALIIGAAMMFSSTIIGLKLLPTTVLHHQRTGEIVISILLLQDFIAIFILLMLHAGNDGSLSLIELGHVALALPALVIFAFLVERFVLINLISRFSRIHEFMFLVAIGWCLGIGQLAEFMKLSFEVGAFIAGISIAQSPVSRFIAESLRPIRDFFLILFFFSLGAKINLANLSEIWEWAVLFGGIMLLAKPAVFRALLGKIAPSKESAWEVGVRIGQISEFSLLVSYTAEKNNLISQSAYSLIQAATILTFIVSSYWIVNRYPTPIAASDRLRRD
ncbi:MAG: cation:proton antiporter [Proteobacteria bacterium]|nr:cation:proton antiporter [Pseudomonadota bacterium]